MSLEANKIAAAILVGGMLTLSVGLVSNIIYGGPEGGHEGAESAGAPAEGAAAPAGEAVAEAPAAAVDAVTLIAAADPAKGEKVAGKCKACHSFESGGPNRVGPNLWGVVGGKTAHKDDFNYSDAIKGLNGTWDYANLDKWLTSPKTFTPGNKMTIPRLPKAEDRAALIRWPLDQNDSTLPLPP